jgi:hypothetical protein
MPLPPRDDLRARSTRATIPPRFQNVFHWSDLKGRPLEWVERYFDVFVYAANWSTNQFMVKLPRRLFDADAAHPYIMEESPDRGAPRRTKRRLLLKMASKPMPAQAELMRWFHQATAPLPNASPGGRTVAALIAAAKERGDERRRQEAERQAAERARQERKAATARATNLASLASQEESLWRQVDALIETRQPKQYDRAVVLLTDLHDLSALPGDESAFMERRDTLRERYAKRPALLARLDGAELNA